MILYHIYISVLNVVYLLNLFFLLKPVSELTRAGNCDGLCLMVKICATMTATRFGCFTVIYKYYKRQWCEPFFILLEIKFKLLVLESTIKILHALYFVKFSLRLLILSCKNFFVCFIESDIEKNNSTVVNGISEKWYSKGRHHKVQVPLGHISSKQNLCFCCWYKR